jgi:hypothetical protein
MTPYRMCVVLTILFFLFAWRPAAPAQTADSIINVSANAGESCTPRVVCDRHDRLHVVWCDNLTGYWEIYYRCIRDGQPGPTRQLSTFAGHAYTPALAVDSAGRVHVAWANEIAGSYDIYYTCLIDPQWSPVLNLSSDPGVSAEPCLAAGAGRSLYVAWRNQMPDGDDIFFRAYADTAWGSITNLSRLPDISREPAIAITPAGLLSVAWSDDSYGAWRIYTTHCDQKGNWSGRDDVYAEQYDAGQPVLAVDSSGLVTLAWEVRFENRTDILSRTWRGGRWSALTPVSTAKGHATSVRLLTLPPRGLAAVWQETYLQTFMLKYRVRRNGTWQKPVTVRSRDTECRGPGLAADSRGRLWCVWQEQQDGQWEVLLQPLP